MTEDVQNPAEDETAPTPSQPDASSPDAPDSSDQTQADTEQPDATQKPDLADRQDETEQGASQNEETGTSVDEPDIPATSESTAGIALALTAVMAGGVLVLLHRRKAK